MKPRVLLWGLLEDSTFRSVHDALLRTRADIVFVNHAAVDRTEARFSTGDRVEHTLACDGATWRLEEFSAAYLRPYDWRDYGLATSPAAAANAVAVHRVVGDWAQHTGATVINRPAAEGSNRSKLYQAIHARAAGFATPESLVTNDPAQIAELHARHGSIVCKSLSSVRSVVRELSPDELGDREIGPAFVQQRIHGREVRVHVVGDLTFAHAIEADGVDYRYDPAATLAPFEVGDDVAARCLGLARRLGLVLAGIDLVVTADEEWFCLEANPNPGFSYYDHFEEGVVARAVADLLARGPAT